MATWRWISGKFIDTRQKQTHRQLTSKVCSFDFHLNTWKKKTLSSDAFNINWHLFSMQFFPKQSNKINWYVRIDFHTIYVSRSNSWWSCVWFDNTIQFCTNLNEQSCCKWQCSVTCGSGIKNRTAICVLNNHVVNDNECDAQMKPKDMYIKCQMEPCWRKVFETTCSKCLETPVPLFLLPL